MSGFYDGSANDTQWKALQREYLYVDPELEKQK